MGVHGLWDLLAPVGRRVSVETLAGKKLAIDASIWMVQFMKAMRDEKGEMIRNAHILGFFRRICKLLYLRTKPVFVFDGGTPALKRRTVIARRRQRENAQTKIRKTAEKLLLNHLKAMRLKELAKDLEEQRQRQKENDAKAKSAVNVDRSAAPSMVDKDGSLNKNASMSVAAATTVHKDDDDYDVDEEMILKNNTKGKKIMLDDPDQAGMEWSNAGEAGAFAIADEDYDDVDEEIILPEMPENVDPAVFAALPQSMQSDFLVRQKNNAKGKKILLHGLDQAGMGGSYAREDGVALSSYNQEKLDEMLAASIAAEEDGNLAINAFSSVVVLPSEEVDEDEDEDEDEEMILPAMHGNVDPAVLAALPPSMQLDLLVQMRERLMAENRQKYQKVKKAPEKFSELQIQAYLKTVTFRREINEVQKATAGRGLGGVQTSRIASESNREFIFSSSFTGDKQVLTSARVEKNGDKQQQMPVEPSSSDFTSRVASVSKSKAVSGWVPDESRSAFDDDVETYLDERGRVRVSRVRAMGMRMTRDLQRNLDLMKEREQDTTNVDRVANAKSMLNWNNVGTLKSSGENQCVGASDDLNGKFTKLNKKNEQSTLKNGTSIEISFEDDGKDKCLDDDDDLFASLAAGGTVTISSAENISSSLQPSYYASDCDWEEGITEGKVINSSNDVEAEINSSFKEGDAGDESEVEWEEPSFDVQKDPSSYPSDSGNTVSRGFLEEEADFHEAIRRSLVDLRVEKSNNVSSGLEESKSPGENASKGVDFFDGENHLGGPNNKSFCEIVDGVEELDNVNAVNLSPIINSSGRQLKSSKADPKKNKMLCGPCERYSTSHLEQSSRDTSDRGAESVCLPEATDEQIFDASDVSGGVSAIASSCSRDVSHISNAVCDAIPDAFISHDKKNDSGSEQLVIEKNVTEPEPSILVNVEKNDAEGGQSIVVDDKKSDTESGLSIPLMELSAKDTTNDIDIKQRMASKSTHDNHIDATEHNIDKSSAKACEKLQVNFTEASLEEEMLFLGKERINLGDEQRRLERNAESVSSEMFAECQELLQMFGLPYIIAPMEAEAQCAYLELANLVDGIVTDDSDVFLFGGRSVYKNIFDDRKYVETYFMKDIEKELGLTRDQLMRMALLLGSDYTEGVSGIGIVNAIEVVNAFPEENGLHKFREWVESPDPTILGNFDVQTGSSMSQKDGSHPNCNAEGASAADQDIFHTNEGKNSADYFTEMKQIFMDKHRNVSKNWHIPSSFPSETVISAYSSPQVDKSTESFSWGKPDLLVLRRLCWEKFGWGSQKSDELLLPVLKEYNKHETQLRLEAFYTFNEKFAKIRSKRIKKAVKGITGNQNSKLTDDAVQEVSRSRNKRRNNPGEAGGNTEKPSEETEECLNGNQQSTHKLSMKRKISSGSVQKGGRQGTNKRSQGNERRRGRGRGKGRGSGIIGLELSDPSSSDDNISDDKQKVYGGKSEVLRRSTRSRKPVNYSHDTDIDDVGKLVDQRNILCTDDKAAKQDSCLDDSICQESAAKFNGSEVGNPSLEESFCRDNLEREGRFCVDEGEIDRAVVSPNGDSPSEATELSKDYFNMGGGFCLDEGEMGEDVEEANHNIGSVEQISGIKRAFEGPQGGGMTGALVTELNVDCQKTAGDGIDSNVRMSLQEDGENAMGITSVGALSAMPFLRRKRRKS
ncbi:XPG_N domain-containing protein/XPG_I domain-containing protein [Cephalotus follicularis]|uniref:XPG_N domain-containing protein/XPG_I domain-containing protein n=1 Tax=Cephalotus follicularis TaxID=3775 RepID=A0A1Q3BXJ6_CEPFO|nr:XPG_N domain-containing protein/XPG_I domain-containing protein [Cephalotus follicularis]